MTKLYISEETLDKLSRSKDFQSYAEMFDGFVANHPKSRQSKNGQPTVKGNKNENQNQKKPSAQFPSPHQPITREELTQDDKIEIALQQMKDSLAQTRNSYQYSAHKTKSKARKKKKRNRNKVISQANSPQPPKNQKTKVLQAKKQQNKTTPTSKAFSIDYNNLIDEYESREVEFGRGRAKSKEWNDEIAKNFQKELKERRKNPDWTDRFALK